MSSLKVALSRFTTLINSCWGSLSSIIESDRTGSFLEDWLQANWELIVEGSLYDKGVVLEPYGEGADCNGGSSRVFYPDRDPTHRLVCVSRKNDGVFDSLNQKEVFLDGGAVFDRFVSIGDDGWYYEVPPFDKILSEFDGEAVVIGFDDIDIVLQLLE